MKLLIFLRKIIFNSNFPDVFENILKLFLIELKSNKLGINPCPNALLVNEILDTNLTIVKINKARP